MYCTMIADANEIQKRQLNVCGYDYKEKNILQYLQIALILHVISPLKALTVMNSTFL